MLVIPETFKNNHEDYITLPAIKSFIKTHNINTKISGLREELVEDILQYGNQSTNNAEEVLNWIDETLHEGIKDVHLQYSEISSEMKLLLSSHEKIAKHLNNYLNNNIDRHICKNKYTKNMVLVNATVHQTHLGTKIKFVFCLKLHMHDKNNMKTKEIDFPIFSEYFIDQNWLLVRAKPRSNLYIFDPDGFNIENAKSTTTDKQIRDAINLVDKIFNFEKQDKVYISEQLKNRIFNLLDKYSKTPKEIEDIISKKSQEIKQISIIIKNICSVPITMHQDIEDDVQNIVEKYLSINWPDKDIFIKDRDAYPVKLSATDEEESKVEQIAALLQPLQTKTLFFDNKKMLYKNKACDGVVFQWKRTVHAYFNTDNFPVKIYVNSKGNCIFKFTEYTSEEDIENVIFSIIDTNGEIEQSTAISNR